MSALNVIDMTSPIAVHVAASVTAVGSDLLGVGGTAAVVATSGVGASAAAVETSEVAHPANASAVARAIVPVVIRMDLRDRECCLSPSRDARRASARTNSVSVR